MTDFNTIADSYLQQLADNLEDMDKAYAIEVEYEQGVLTIDVVDKQYVINKHGPTEQIWFSSPVSNVGRLVYANNDWYFEEKRYLDILKEELNRLTETQQFSSL